MVKEYHDFLRHAGFDRLWPVLNSSFEWGNETEAKVLAQMMMGACGTCQACRAPVSLKNAMEYTPVPPLIMDSMALDMFSMPSGEVEGGKYDNM